MSKGKSGGGKGGVAVLDRSPSHLLHRTLQVALDVYAEEFGAGAITHRQFAVLAAAGDHEGATQTDLVKITGIDRSTLADMVARMITKGHLERERSGTDARANAVRLTEAGRAALADARPKMAKVDARLLKLISGGGRREAFVGLLKDLIDGRETAVAKAKPAAKPDKVERPAVEKPAKAAGKKKKKAKKAA